MFSKANVRLTVVPVLITALYAHTSNAQSLSDTFVDSNVLQINTAQTPTDDRETTATLVQIETGLNEAALTASNPDVRVSEITSLLNYLSPVLTDPQFIAAIGQLMPDEYKDAQNRAVLPQGDNYQNDTFLRLQRALDTLERSPLPDELRAILPPSTRSLAMYALTSALRYGACLELLIQTIDGSADTDTDGNTTEVCEVPRLGKIRAWQFDAGNRTGSLFVDDMKVDRYTFRYDVFEGIARMTLIEQWSYDWEVEVLNTEIGYTRAIRDSQRDFLARLQSNPNADPFVDKDSPSPSVRPALPADAKNFVNPDSIWGRGLTGRLFANGQDVSVKSVTGKRYAMEPIANAGATADFDTVYTAADGVEYFRDHVVEGNVVFGPDHALLQSSDDSCIDIMFALPDSGVFPTTILEFPETQRGWCMGRCASPLIANSR